MIQELQEECAVKATEAQTAGESLAKALLDVQEQQKESAIIATSITDIQAVVNIHEARVQQVSYIPTRFIHYPLSTIHYTLYTTH